jgi:ribosome-binding ATPase YchF (GTP1/OBG family)
MDIIDSFDYIDEDGKKQQYEPDSDMSFTQFKELMKTEWATRKKFEQHAKNLEKEETMTKKKEKLLQKKKKEEERIPAIFQPKKKKRFFFF